MSVTTTSIRAPQEKVWEVLCDGWLYPLWVVGATHMREVDDRWPGVGTRLHHAAGAWPLVIHDTTEVTALTPGTSLSLRARGWPAGEAQVVITLRAAGSETEVEVREDAVSGPGRLVPAPLRKALLHWRNVEALRRLSAVVEGR